MFNYRGDDVDWGWIRDRGVDCDQRVVPAAFRHGYYTRHQQYSSQTGGWQKKGVPYRTRDLIPCPTGGRIQIRGHILHSVKPVYDRSSNGRRRWIMEDKQVGGESLMDYRDRKSTRLSSSHMSISYAVFCLKKK